MMARFVRIEFKTVDEYRSNCLFCLEFKAIDTPEGISIS
jgi:hypothetical protein